MAVADFCKGDYIHSYSDFSTCDPTLEIWQKALAFRKLFQASYQPFECKTAVYGCADLSFDFLTATSKRLCPAIVKNSVNKNNKEMSLVTWNNVIICDRDNSINCSTSCSSSDSYSNTCGGTSTQLVTYDCRMSSNLDSCYKHLTDPSSNLMVLSDTSSITTNCSSNCYINNCCIGNHCDFQSSGSGNYCSSGSVKCDIQFHSSSRTRNSLAFLKFSDVIEYAIIFCVLVVVCSASCNKNQKNTSNCSTSGITGPTTQTNSNSSTSGSGFPLVNETNSSSYKQNHLFEVRESSQENPVVKPGDEAASRPIGTGQSAKDGDQAYLLATDMAPAEEDHRDISNIVSLIIPFVCVIILAIILCVTWKLCRKYQCCYNEACLQKCSSFCNNCMSTPYVFQAASEAKIQISCDSVGLTNVSQYRPTSVSQVYRTGAVVRQPLYKLNMSRKNLVPSSSDLSRHSSSRSSSPSVGYAPVSRQSLVHGHTVRQSSGKLFVTKENI